MSKKEGKCISKIMSKSGRLQIYTVKEYQQKVYISPNVRRAAVWRKTLGLPAEWGSTDNWLSATSCQWPKKSSQTSEMVKKAPEIPLLEDYSKSTPAWF